jgi:hypothetical protein
MNPISDSPPTADEALQPLKAGDERFIAALRASHGAKEILYLQKFFLDSWPNQPLQQTGPAITVFRGIMSSRAARLLSLPLRLSVKEKVLS